MVVSRSGLGKAGTTVEFRSPAWDRQHPNWRQIDGRIPEEHLAHCIDEGVDNLDLRPLIRSYQGRGSPPWPPDLMLKIVMYEIATGTPSPAGWFRATRDSDTVKWLGFGIQPSRTICYDFWDRLAPYFDGWNAQVLQSAVDRGLTSASRAAQDGTTVAAHASRHKLVNQETLKRHLEELEETLSLEEEGGSPERVPGWMAKHPETRQEQRLQYERASERMEQLQVENRKRRACKRKSPEKIVVSVSDSEAACGRDKLKVFRPLYNVQLNYDLDSPFILGYDVFDRVTDSGTLSPMLERTSEMTGVKPEVLLADSGYATILDLDACAHHGVILYAPVNENDYSERNDRKPQTNQFTQLPKSQFSWLVDEGTYMCPQGNRLRAERTTWVKRAGDQRLRNTTFRCPAEKCQVCPRQTDCTPTPDKGRTVSRLEKEELLDELRIRMQSDEAKALHRLRSRTVELAFVDMKEHGSLRRFNGRGLRKARAQIGALVLAHNLLALLRERHGHETANTTRTLEKSG